MHERMIAGWILLAILVPAAGCATRGVVRDLDTQVTQQGQELAATGRHIDAIDQHTAGLSQRVDAVEARVRSLADHHHATTVVDSLDVTFRFGRADLDDGAMTRLNDLAKTVHDDSRLALEVVGYTDAQGPLAYNVQLAQRRAEAVRRYLVSRGVPVSRVAAVGLGPATDAKGPDAKKRRVAVQLTTSETMTAAAVTAMPSPVLSTPAPTR